MKPSNRGDPGPESVLLGWPEDGVTVRLDYRQFSYAGKFVMSTTGKAVIRDPGVAAVSADDGPEAFPADDDREAVPVDGGPDAVPDDEFDRRFLAAAAFNEDRTDDRTLWIRYITVRKDRRGEGLGPQLASFVVDRAFERGYDQVKIAVNNPFAYQALYRAGFAYTGDQTGLAELVLSTAGDRSTSRYREGFSVFEGRDRQSEAERRYVEAHRDGDPPDLNVSTGRR